MDTRKMVLFAEAVNAASIIKAYANKAQFLKNEIPVDIRKKLNYGPEDEVADILATGKIEDILYAAETFIRQIPKEIRKILDQVDLSDYTRKYFNELDTLGAEPFVQHLNEWAKRFTGRFVVEPYDFDTAISMRSELICQANELAALLAPATVFEDCGDMFVEIATY
jgi:hypothetical protein